MSCYPCTHCNKCGMYSVQIRLVCAECGEPIGVGVSECPKCGCARTREEVLGVGDEPKADAER